jgi:hypothetical protein
MFPILFGVLFRAHYILPPDKLHSVAVNRFHIRPQGIEPLELTVQIDDKKQ